MVELGFKRDIFSKRVRASQGLSMALLALLLPFSASAELEPLQDEQLGDITGQAFIQLEDRSYNGKDFLRLDLGMDIETQFTIDELNLGNYERWENGAPCPTCTGNEAGLEQKDQDILAYNFAFGEIAETSGIKHNGKYYNAGEIVPFEIKDPYIEISQKNGELNGFRIGFNQARGMFAGDIRSLTGRLPVELVDTASALVGAPGAPLWLQFAGAILNQTPIGGTGQLVTGPTNGDMNTGGQLDPVRASWLGIPSGEDFTVYGVPFFGDINFATTGCNVFGVPTCFEMRNYNALPIGPPNGDGTFGFTEGWFLSMQDSPTEWLDPITQEVQSAPAGFYLSLPVGGVEFSLSEAFQGTDYPRLEYINRGNGLF